jgi:hypothetical protein
MTSSELWQALEEESHNKQGRGILVRRIYPQSKCNLFLGFEKPENKRIFLLRINRSVLPPIGSLPEARGIEILARPLPYDGKHEISLGIILKEPRFQDIFTTLVDDIAERIAVLPSEKESVATFVSRLQRWQKFLENSSEGLGDEAQRGLYGELYFLREYVLQKLGPLGIFAWTGWRRTAQDFQFPGCAVEVKTSAAKQHQKLKIASERQLDDTNLGSLFLYHLSLEQSQGNGETLVDVVETIRGVLISDPAAKEALEDALLESGYLQAHAFRYAKNGYRIRESNVFKVTEGFPRIIERDIPNGVGDVAYSIIVAECKHHSIPASEMEAMLTMPKYKME